MVKKILLMMRRNSMTLLGAAILASGIFYVVNNPNNFMASVLSLQEEIFIAEKGWDVAYKTNSGYMDIFISQNLETPEKIDFTIIFDKDSISIDPENLSGQGTWKINNQNENSISIQSTPGENIEKNQSIILLPFTGDMRNILLSEAVANPDTKKQKNLSIGSLNEITSHSQQ